jgi:alkanesulfonate monooxygenase SsuD/methylene tetrahydromethanopterin reductase-like flavin-dependent oxidoreductase (luciferase family)
LRLIEEICMLDHLSDGRLEVGVGRGGVLEAYFWGSNPDVEQNLVRYRETLAIPGWLTKVRHAHPHSSDRFILSLGKPFAKEGKYGEHASSV